MSSQNWARRSFLQSALAISASPHALQIFSGNESQPQTAGGAGLATGAFAVNPGATRPGKDIPVRGTFISVKVSGDDNGGGFALFEVPASPGSGPPMHMHHVENECFYVLEGALKVQVGAELFTLEPGGSVYLPKMIPHTWQTLGQKNVRLLSFAQPAGRLEAYVVALSELMSRGIPDSASMKTLFEKYDMEMTGPPLPV